MEAASPGRRACVIDLRLALGPYGLQAVASLSRFADVWVPPTLHGILTEPHRTRGLEGALVPVSEHEEDGAVARETRIIQQQLALWSRRPEDEELAAFPFFHIGERADETLVPADVDRRLRDRFEQLQRSLYQRIQAGPQARKLLFECVCDDLALCATLAPYAPVLLSRADHDAGTPSLVAFLDACGIATRKIAGGGEANELRALLSRAALEPLAPEGLRPIAAHLVLSGMPPFAAPESDVVLAQRWGEATLCWYEVWS